MSVTNQFGYACAQAVVFGIILVVVSFALKSLSNRMKQA
jgi:ABC-type sugar transport system permease subunit